MSNKVGIYKRNGASVSRFSKKDYDLWDEHGRNVCIEFYTNYGWKIENNDGKGTQVFNPCDTDLRVMSPSGNRYYVEVETKKSGFAPKYLHDGIHFTWRKINGIFVNKQRDPKRTLFITVNESGDQLILVRGEYLKMAFDIWPEYAGFGETNGTEGFKNPDHGCFPIYKNTFRGYSPEHFISIAWDRVSHYTKSDGKWKRVKSSDKKFIES